MRMVLCVFGLVAVLALSGCVGAMVPLYAPIATDVRGSVGVGDSSAGATKVGTASAEAIILLAFGDASIDAAARSRNITRIHHVDCEITNILGLYAKYTTIVYGE